GTRPPLPQDGSAYFFRWNSSVVFFSSMVASSLSVNVLILSVSFDSLSSCLSVMLTLSPSTVYEPSIVSALSSLLTVSFSLPSLVNSTVEPGGRSPLTASQTPTISSLFDFWPPSFLSWACATPTNPNSKPRTPASHGFFIGPSTV